MFRPSQDVGLCQLTFLVAPYAISSVILVLYILTLSIFSAEYCLSEYSVPICLSQGTFDDWYKNTDEKRINLSLSLDPRKSFFYTISNEILLTYLGKYIKMNLHGLCHI